MKFLKKLWITFLGTAVQEWVFLVGHRCSADSNFVDPDDLGGEARPTMPTAKN